MRSTPIFKILSLAVLVAVVTLLGIEGYRYFHRSVSVSVAYTGQVTDSLSVTGWVVRQETPLPDTSGTLLRQVQEGEKVHAGQTVAMAYASKSALEVVSRLEDTELKLQQLQFCPQLLFGQRRRPEGGQRYFRQHSPPAHSHGGR